MIACTFFGHRIITESIETELTLFIEHLIHSKNVDMFYVGNQGSFDETVLNVLLKLKGKYNHITYAVVFAYHPSRYNEINYVSIYPEEFENIPPKFAIDKRNRWMIEKSKYAIVYVKKNGGASKYEDIAKRKGLEIYNLYHQKNSLTLQ